MTKRLALSLTVVLVLCSLGFHAVAAETTVLRVMTFGSAEYIENTRIFFREFERQNPDLRVEIEVGSLEKFIVMTAAGEPPDLVRVLGYNVPEYAAKGLIQSLEPFLRESQKVSVADFIPAALGSLSYQGELYSIPWGLSAQTMFVNVDKYAEVGLSIPDASWTWEEEALAAARRLTRDIDGDGSKDQFFMNHDGGVHDQTFAYIGGGKLFDDVTWEYLADSQESIDGLQLKVNLIHEHQVAAGPGIVPNVRDWRLLSGNVSTEMTGSWFVSSLLLTNPSFEWDIALTPSFRGERGTAIWPETPWVIPAGVPHPELSWRMIEFIGSVEGQTLAAELGLAIPPIRLDVASTVLPELYPNQNIHYVFEMAIAPWSRSIPTAPENARNALTSALGQIMRGDVPVRTALESARPAAEAAVQEFLASLH